MDTLQCQQILDYHFMIFSAVQINFQSQHHIIFDERLFSSSLNRADAAAFVFFYVFDQSSDLIMFQFNIKLDHTCMVFHVASHIVHIVIGNQDQKEADNRCSDHACTDSNPHCCRYP